MIRTNWFAVRCVIISTENRPWGPTDLLPGEAAYEERITLWRAPNMSGALQLAEDEARAYAAAIEGQYLGFAQAYHLANAPGHGQEIFSLVRRSHLDASKYVDRFFDSGGEYQEPMIDPGSASSDSE